MIILALTALGSTWCAYQAQLWNGVQLVRLTDLDLATAGANESRLAARERKTLDGIVFFHFIEAIHRNDAAWGEAIRARMDPPLRAAVEAWLKLDPLNNPSVPGPAKLPQYVLPEDQRADELERQAGITRALAQAAGQNGDSYVLLALMYALVLFFGGIMSTFERRVLRLTLGGVACALFLVTSAWLFLMPMAA